MLKCWQSCPDRNAAFGWVSAQLPSLKTHDHVLAISHHSKRELDKKRLYTSNKDRNCTEFMQCITRKTKALKKMHLLYLMKVVCMNGETEKSLTWRGGVFIRNSENVLPSNLPNMALDPCIFQAERAAAECSSGFMPQVSHADRL